MKRYQRFQPSTTEYRYSPKERKAFIAGKLALCGAVDYLRWRCEADDAYGPAQDAMDLVLRLQRELSDASVARS